MIDESKAISVIENSFIAPLLKIDSITDISYNGKEVFFQDNNKGRQKSDITISNISVSDFLRQVANLTEKKFSIREPILDTSVGKYRLNAVHASLGRKNHGKVPTFSLRIAHDGLNISDDEFFLSKKAQGLLKVILAKGISLLIGGKTGSGKTVLQRNMLTFMKPSTRIIVIDNVLELDNNYENLDLDMTIWQYDDQKENVGISYLVKNALRSNPDWLIVAEARGEEMRDVLNSALTGHPIITTMHSQGIDTMISRVISMVMMANKKISYKEVRNDILSHFRFLFYLKKFEKDGQIIRYVSQIAFINKDKNTEIIYENDQEKIHHLPLSKNLIEVLSLNDEFVQKWGE